MTEIEKLKDRAKKLHKKYYDKLSTFSCGSELAETISPSLHRMWVEYLEILTKLKKIDPSFPTE